MTWSEGEMVRRIENAPLGLASVMRQHDAVFYRERGSQYIIDVPKRTRSGKRDHRVYEEWTISKDRVELMTKDLAYGMPPIRFDAQPVKGKSLAHSRKEAGGKRIR